MRKIFIDAGAHIGESVDRFKASDEYSSDFEIFCFEPVPHFLKYFANRQDITFYNNAVWINNDSSHFFVDETHNKASGSTLNKDKKSGKLNVDKPITVQCIDFDKWIKDNFAKDDYIILKMDIEGAEYNVLPRMISHGSIEYIDKAYVEFHWEKIGMTKEQHVDLIGRLNSLGSFELCPEFYTVS